MKNIFALLYLFSLSILSQEKINEQRKAKSNPVIYADLILGPSMELSGAGTLFIGGALNFQNKNDLFSLRYIENADLKTTWFVFFPIFITRSTNNEMALLYGKRFINDNKSYSFSGGLSYNNYEKYSYDYNNNTLLSNVPANQITTSSENFLGFPFEAEVRWFNSQKERYRIFYGLIPIGKPTSFGRSFGFKILGNISKQSYVGAGLIFGLGLHKQY